MNFDPKKTVYIIDGSSFLYRAYYSLRPLHSSKGIPVQAVYGFCRMIKRLIDTFHPAYMVLVWDSKGKTTRHELLPSYKATRQAPPSDLFEQKKYILQFADLIGLKQLAQQGIEADDIIYSLAKERADEGDTVVMLTADKDMGQALSSLVYMYDTFKEKLIDVPAFEAEKGFPVNKLPFYYALVGDASDNIPGVKGIGKTGALKLVQQFDSLIDLYEHLDQVDTKRIRVALEADRENAFLSQDLFVLHYYPTGLSRDDCSFDENSWDQARPLFKELDFNSLLQESGVKKNEQKVVDPLTVLANYDFRAITTEQELDELCKKLRETGSFALDTETLGLQPLSDAMVGLSICYKEGIAYYIPFGHTTGDQLSRDQIVRALKPILEDPAIGKYLHNTKFDQLVLLSIGILLQGVVDDTCIAASLLMPQGQRSGLKSLSEHFFNEPMLAYADLMKQYKIKNFAQLPLDVATRYAASDAHQTFKLQRVLAQEFAKEPTLYAVYKTIELPLAQVLVHMEAHGIYLESVDLQQLNVELTKRLIALENEIILLADYQQGAINLNSPKQVQELLFVKLQLPPKKKSAKGGYSTDQEVLEQLSALHVVPRLIIQYRELAKLKSTYVEALPTYINPITKRVHTTYNQVSVATGRLASSDPNLQNIPVSGEFGLEIRAAFKAETGHTFIAADYSQIELRVLAHLSGDEQLTQAFLQGHDIHAQTASRLFDVSLEQVTHEQRQIGKRINFSILYGLTPYGLSKDLGISFKDAKTYIDKYFAQYPKVSRWMESVVEHAKKNGFVTTFFGRRRTVPAIYEQNKVLYDEAARIAINTVAQGTAAEIMKKGMIQLDEQFTQQHVDAHLVLQIHDELLVSVRDEHVARAVELLLRIPLNQL